MKFGSLFSGIGGMDLGLERAGMECAWQVEIDDYCQKVLTKHWPDVPKFGEVRNVGKSNLETVDLIAGGFPCQPHSVAGKRKGAEDDRNLWPEYLRIIKELKPRYVLAENVPGIITTYIDTVLSDLEGQGYTCATFNIPAVAFDAPHRRERIFILAYSSEVRCERLNGIQERLEHHERRESFRKSDSQSSLQRNVSNPLRFISESRTGGRGVRQGDKNVADTIRGRRESRSGREKERNIREFDKSGLLANPQGIHAQGFNQRQGQRKPGRESWWTVEPDVGRVAHGIPSRVDRLRGLGNAVVPQVAQWIGERIIEFDKELV